VFDGGVAIATEFAVESFTNLRDRYYALYGRYPSGFSRAFFSLHPDHLCLPEACGPDRFRRAWTYEAHTKYVVYDKVPVPCDLDPAPHP